jgi:RNA polymerase sigma-70 factor (ECF subfamily)
MLSDDTDAVLVQQVQAGNKEAFGLIVRKYQQRLYKLVCRYIRDPSEAQDLTQEAFIKAYKGLANFRGDSALYTWLYRIAVNTAKNYLVSQSRRAQADVDINDAEHYEGMAANAAKEWGTPERQLLTQEIQQVIFQVIESLPDDLRSAVTLREFDGLSYEEIAQIMDCPIGTVRSRIFRAREAIDKALKPLLDD